MITGKLSIFQHFDCLNYCFGGTTFFDTRRGVMTLELMREQGLLEQGVKIIKANKVNDRSVVPYHSREYLTALMDCCATGKTIDEMGLNTPVMRLRKDSYHSCLAVVSSTLGAGLHTLETGEPTFSPYGGLHHGRKSKAAGYCVLNDIAITAGTLSRKWNQRVSILDLDLHPGDGTEQMLLDYPDIQTVSIHMGSQTQERIDWEHSSLNYSVMQGTRDDLYLTVLEKALQGIAAFKPDILIVQCGVDTFYGDAMKMLHLTMPGFESIYTRINQFAQDKVDNRVVYTGGGGYGYRFCAPRAWTLLASIVVGAEIKNELSENWTDVIRDSIEGAVDLQKGMPPEVKNRVANELLSEVPHKLMD